MASSCYEVTTSKRGRSLQLQLFPVWKNVSTAPLVSSVFGFEIKIHWYSHWLKSFRIFNSKTFLRLFRHLCFFPSRSSPHLRENVSFEFLNIFLKLFEQLITLFIDKNFIKIFGSSLFSVYIQFNSFEKHEC